MTQAASAVRHYHNKAERPRRMTQCDRIVAFLEKSGRARTLKEIATAIGLPDSTVSGRLNELEQRKILTTFMDRKCEINGYVKQTWFLAPPDPQGKLFRGAR